MPRRPPQTRRRKRSRPTGAAGRGSLTSCFRVSGTRSASGTSGGFLICAARTVEVRTDSWKAKTQASSELKMLKSTKICCKILLLTCCASQNQLVSSHIIPSNALVPVAAPTVTSWQPLVLAILPPGNMLTALQACQNASVLTCQAKSPTFPLCFLIQASSTAFDPQRSHFSHIFRSLVSLQDSGGAILHHLLTDGTFKLYQPQTLDPNSFSITVQTFEACVAPVYHTSNTSDDLLPIKQLSLFPRRSCPALTVSPLLHSAAS